MPQAGEGSCSGVAASALADLDLLFLFGDLGGLRQTNAQYALVKLRLNPSGVRVIGERDGPAERTVAALDHVPVLVLVGLIALGLFFTPDSQDTIRQRDVDVLFIYAR